MASYNGSTPRARKERKISILFRHAEGDKKHCAGVESVLYSQENQSLFSASRDGSIRRWCTRSAQPSMEMVYEGHSDWVNDLLLVQDLLISCSNDKTVRVWRGMSQSGTLLSTLTHHSDYVTCLAASPERHVIASAGLRGEIFLVDLKTGSTIHLYPAQARTLSGVTPSSPGMRVSSPSGTAQLTGQQPQVPTKGSVYSLAMQPSGSLLAAGSTDHAVRLWDPRTCSKVGKLRGHLDNVRSLLIKHDGTQLLSGSSDSTIKLWDLGMQRCIQTYSVHSDSVWSLLASNDFSMVYSGGRDKAVYRTQLTSRTAELLFMEEQPVRSMAIDSSTSGMWVAAGSSSLNMWSVPSELPTNGPVGFERHSFVARRVRHPTSVSLPRQGAADQRPKEPAVAGPTFTIPGVPPIVHHKVMNDRHHILTRDADGMVALWDVLAGAVVEEYGKVDIAAKEKELFEPKAVPSWFSSDNRMGQLCITLDVQNAFSAEEYGIMLGCKDMLEDHKVNFGKLLLNGAFAKWRRKAGSVITSPTSSSSGGLPPPSPAESGPLLPGLVADSSSQLGGKGCSGALPGRAVPVASGAKGGALASITQGGSKEQMLSAPSVGLGEDDRSLLPVLFWRLPTPQQPAVMCQMASGQQWFRPISQFTGAELEPDEIPTWVGDVVLRDASVSPKESKCAFVLMPAEGSNLPQLSQSKLNAPRILQVHKVANYCMVKLQEINLQLDLKPVYLQRPAHAAQDPVDTGRPALELLCNGMGVPYEMSLASVKKYIWKKSDDLIFHFRVRDPAKLAPMPVIQPPS